MMARVLVTGRRRLYRFSNGQGSAGGGLYGRGIRRSFDWTRERSRGVELIQGDLKDGTHVESLFAHGGYDERHHPETRLIPRALMEAKRVLVL